MTISFTSANRMTDEARRRSRLGPGGIACKKGTSQSKQNMTDEAREEEQARARGHSLRVGHLPNRAREA